MKAAMRKLCAVRNAHVGRRVLAEEVASVTLPADCLRLLLALFPATRAPASCRRPFLTSFRGPLSFAPPLWIFFRLLFQPLLVSRKLFVSSDNFLSPQQPDFQQFENFFSVGGCIVTGPDQMLQ